jgi:MFS family permease
MFGRVRRYEAGFVVFVIGSVLCALAWNEGTIIGFRIVQAVGGILSAVRGRVGTRPAPSPARAARPRNGPAS